MTDSGYTIHPIGVIRSQLTDLDAAPRQGFEGAPEAWLEINPDVASAIDGLVVGDRKCQFTATTCRLGCRFYCMPGPESKLQARIEHEERKGRCQFDGRFFQQATVEVGAVRGTVDVEQKIVMSVHGDSIVLSRAFKLNAARCQFLSGVDNERGDDLSGSISQSPLFCCLALRLGQGLVYRCYQLSQILRGGFMNDTV